VIVHSADHVERGQRNKLAQFRGKPKLEGLISPWLEQVQELEDVFYDLLILRWLPNATGRQLDILGRIVGQIRGGRTDSVYRLWIAARSLVNRSSGLTEQIYGIVRKLVGADIDIFLSEEPPAGFTMRIEDAIDANDGAEIAKILRLAKAAGVRANLEWFSDANVFRFAPTSAEVPDAAYGFNRGRFASASAGGPVVWPGEPVHITDRLGASLLGCFEVPATDDATIDVIAGRVQSINDATGGGPAMAAVTAGNRPHYRTGASGPNGEPYLEVDTGLYLEVPFSVVGSNRVCLYVVMMAPSDPGAVRDVVTMSGVGTSRLRIDGSADRYVHVQSFDSAGQVTLSLTSPPLVLGRWHLHALRPLASGARSEIDGLATTPNFATADFGAEITTVRVGSSGAAAGAVKAIYLVDDPSDAEHAEIFDYVYEKGWLQ
jgi:hypothetical protein